MYAVMIQKFKRRAFIDGQWRRIYRWRTKTVEEDIKEAMRIAGSTPMEQFPCVVEHRGETWDQMSRTEEAR